MFRGCTNFNDKMISVIFAGDIDGDGIVDFKFAKFRNGSISFDKVVIIRFLANRFFLESVYIPGK